MLSDRTSVCEPSNIQQTPAIVYRLSMANVKTTKGYDFVIEEDHHPPFDTCCKDSNPLRCVVYVELETEAAGT
jgi:hypothetical protein